MNKEKMKQRAAEVIPLLKTMFGEGIAFESVDCYKSNEELVGISMRIPGCSDVPVVYMDDMPEGASAKEIAGIAAATFQEALHTIKNRSLIPHEINRETILENVVLQALGRKRNRALLREHPHTLCLDLAGVFRLPAGPYEKNTLNTVLITNRHIETAGLTVKELTEAAQRNTLAKFGVQLMNARERGMCLLQGRHWSSEPFENVRMNKPGLYTLTNQILINGAALLLLPEILEQIAEKAEMDYFILPSSIHEILIAKDDGLVSPKHLKKIVYENNCNPDIVAPTNVLSDSVYWYSYKDKILKIV